MPPTCIRRFRRLADTPRWGILFAGGTAWLILAIGRLFWFWWVPCWPSLWPQSVVEGVGMGRPQPPPTVPTTDTTVVEKEEIEGKEIIPGDDTPGEIRSALERNRPLLVFFYVPGGTDDGLVEDAVDDLEVKFADIFFARYDYRRPQLYGDLAELVGVEYAPTVVMIDAGGYVSKAFSGYVDEGSLNQVLTNIR